MMPLPPPLDDHLCFALYGASMAVGRLYKPMLDELGITYPQYLVLNGLWEHDGRTIGAIAERLSLESSTVTPLVKRLEASGLVRRTRDMADERQVLVGLTEVGWSLRERCVCLGLELLRASGMSLDEIQALNATVRTLRDTIAAAQSGRR